MKRRLFLTVIGLLGSLSVVNATQDDIDAVKRYWSTEHTPRPSAVAMSLPAFGIESLPALPWMHWLIHSRLYCFREGDSAHSSFAVVAVNNERQVRLLDDLDSINQLLSSEQVRVRDSTDARELAEMYLTIRYFTGRKLWGWPHGLKLLRSVEEIEFSKNDDGAAERKALQDAVRIVPPVVRPREGGYEFTAFTWSPSSRQLERVEIALGVDHIESARLELLMSHVGKGSGY